MEKFEDFRSQIAMVVNTTCWQAAGHDKEGSDAAYPADIRVVSDGCALRERRRTYDMAEVDTFGR